MLCWVRKKKKKRDSVAGNRTPVSRVTGGDTHHYTTTDCHTKSVPKTTVITSTTHLKLRRFLFVVGSLAKEAKMSSSMISLCFSYREKIYRDAWNSPVFVHNHSSLKSLTARTSFRALNCSALTFSTKKGSVPSVESYKHGETRHSVTRMRSSQMEALTLSTVVSVSGLVSSRRARLSSTSINRW